MCRVVFYNEDIADTRCDHPNWKQRCEYKCIANESFPTPTNIQCKWRCRLYAILGPVHVQKQSAYQTLKFPFSPPNCIRCANTVAILCACSANHNNTRMTSTCAKAMRVHDEYIIQPFIVLPSRSCNNHTRTNNVGNNLTHVASHRRPHSSGFPNPLIFPQPPSLGPTPPPKNYMT